MLQTCILPDLLEGWPFESKPNSRQDIVAQSAAWVESFNAFDEKAQDAFNRCQFGIFASLAYPKAAGAHFRAACDLMNLFFLFDELSDEASGTEAAKQAKDIMDALRYPDQIPPEGDSVLGAATRDFWRVSLLCASKSSAERFIRNFDEYTDAVRLQAVDRDEGRERSTEEYFELRRGTIGVRPSFDYFLLPDHIPNEAIDHPLVERLAIGSIDMTILANDLYSYNVEQARGDDAHNIVAVIMREKGCTVQEAMDQVGKLYAHIKSAFIENYKSLPTFGDTDVDRLVKEYCWGMGNWVTTNIKWSFSGERYFGKTGLEVMKHRNITLIPKKH
ncbi:hypothetical protein VKT23_016636 [Stygiomarasmius scandens]|uniref:Terpene synthase n=1 Tax=Marasmiellus scandens TaxID=2682957 RepID=A0ABR1IYN5_9AGAR